MTGTIETNISRIQIISMTGTIPANQAVATLTATVPTGWKFLSWLSATASGWSSDALSVFTPNQQTSQIWSGVTSSSARNIIAYYMVCQ